MARTPITVVDRALAHVVRIADSQGVAHLSNKTEGTTPDGNKYVSYRMWGAPRVENCKTMLEQEMGLRMKQQLRFYETRKGRGADVSMDFVYGKSLGMGDELQVFVEVLHSGSVMLRIVALSDVHQFN